MITELIVGITLSLILIAFIYYVFILWIKYRNNVSTNDAFKMVSESIKKVFTAIDNTATSITYPVYIGFNGYDFKPLLVNQAFEKLSRYWQIFFFDTVFLNHPNLVVYQFRVQIPIHKDLKTARLEYLAQAVAEETLALHMRSWNCYIPVDNFIATHLRADVLKIAIAKNAAGLEEISKLRRH